MYECVCEGSCVCGFTSGSGKVPTCALKKASVSKGVGEGKEVRFKCVLLRSTCERKGISGSSIPKPGLVEFGECVRVCVCGLAGDSRVPVRQACM